jgi:2,3-bisphosphoglycerate-dependent phosphoglycerate mutase
MGSPATTIIAIRHGETPWNIESRIQGHLDSGLTELGLRQAEALAATFQGESVDAIRSSDLPRAILTAEAIGRVTGGPVVPDARLRERHHGIFQSLTLEDVESRFPEDFAVYRSRDPGRAIPGGESLRQRHERVVACVEEAARACPGGRVVVVTHGGPLDSLFRHALGLDLALPRRFALPNAARNVFRVAAGRWLLAAWGDTGHLAGLGSGSPYEF